MQNSKVYEWEVFVSFVEQKFGLVSGLASHPVLDAIAADLHVGALQRRDIAGNPVGPWQYPARTIKKLMRTTDSSSSKAHPAAL